MKKYLHKPTSRIYQKFENKCHPSGVYRCEQSDCFLIEPIIVEYGNDWEEIIPKKIPVAALDGKELFQGDKHWYVYTKSNFQIYEHTIIVNIYNPPDTEAFSTKELAEQYVIDHKPVVPLGELNSLIKAFEQYYSNAAEAGSWFRLTEAFNKLKRY